MSKMLPTTNRTRASSGGYRNNSVLPQYLRRIVKVHSWFLRGLAVVWFLADGRASGMWATCGRSHGNLGYSNGTGFGLKGMSYGCTKEGKCAVQVFV